MNLPKTALIIGLVIVALLALKLFKQFIRLAFTLLSLKMVWLVIIVLVLLMWAKKFTQPQKPDE